MMLEKDHRLILMDPTKRRRRILFWIFLPRRRETRKESLKSSKILAVECKRSRGTAVVGTT